MNLDDFLTLQDQRTLACILEEIDGHRPMIRITPWSPSRGVIRSASLAVSRAYIHDVQPRGIEVEVGGLMHAVTSVAFSDDQGGQLLASILHQLATSASAERAALPTPAVSATVPEGPAPSMRRDWCGWHWPIKPDVEPKK